ncbi:MAG: hypothetical protein ACAI44_35320 [Candidatus Sericytochromatia bacterium]
MLALSEDALAWSDAQGVYRMRLPRAGIEKLGTVRARHLALDHDRVAWVEAGTNAIVLHADGQSRILATDHLPWNVLLAGEEILWANVRLIDLMVVNDQGAIRRIRPGGTVETLAEGLCMPDYLNLGAQAELWFSAGRRIMRLDRRTNVCQQVFTQAEDLNGLVLLGDRLFWNDGGMDDALLWAPLPDPGEAIVEPQCFSACPEAIVEMAAAPAGLVWIESPGYDEPCTLRGQSLADSRAWDLPLPHGHDPRSVSCNRSWIACACQEGSIYLARLPDWLEKND